MQRRPSRRKQAPKPKICRFCEGKVNYIDFKDAETLKKFQTEKGKILPRRITGTCLNHQKMLAVAIKRARIIALVY
ncbi:MAG: 30S ribosomal protein S18 [Victivallaceae bacterium]|nr:30S ribosomal protein S18 [Victivallaceae bacterium]